jgi:hypothetical protein
MRGFYEKLGVLGPIYRAGMKLLEAARPKQ